MSSRTTEAVPFHPTVLPSNRLSPSNDVDGFALPGFFMHFRQSMACPFRRSIVFAQPAVNIESQNQKQVHESRAELLFRSLTSHRSVVENPRRALYTFSEITSQLSRSIAASTKSPSYWSRPDCVSWVFVQSQRVIPVSFLGTFVHRPQNVVRHSDFGSRSLAPQRKTATILLHDFHRWVSHIPPGYL